ncbi:MAG: asparagine synthase C-terminal domain-containing protein, partial [Leptospiraceae bacterium]|nr:asparagine synthase C-terminal domain-containing protein [Leptospiraceae bacterium]
KKDYPLTAYSIKLRNNYNQKDESNLASQTAKLLKIEHRVLNVSDQDIINNYVKAIYFSEIPILDHSNVSLMLLAEKVKEDGFQSVLTGEGADEAFGGYPWDYYFNFPGGKHLANLLSLFSNNFNRELNKEYKNYSQNILFSPLSSIRNLFYSKEYLEELKNKKKNYYPVTIDSNWSKVDKFQKSLQLDYEWLLAGHLLLDKGDRMAMSASIESRYPFLDPRLVKYTDSLYKDWKIKNFKNKWILRSLAEKYLPKETAWRKKHLFRVEPVIHGKSYPKWVEELLSPESIKITNLFDYKKVERLFKERLNPKTFSFNNSFIQVGLSGVISTQLLYHLFSDKSLCHLKKSVRGSIPE